MRVFAASLVAAVLLFAAATGDATPPCCAHVPAGLIAWWPGQSDAGDVLAAHSGSLAGDTTFAAGKVGQGFSFDGDDDYVSVPDSPALYSAGSFSVDAWAKTATTGAVMSHYECGGFCVGLSSNSEWELSITAGGHLLGYVRDTDGGGPTPGARSWPAPPSSRTDRSITWRWSVTSPQASCCSTSTELSMRQPR
jgi:hypothetical protein